MSDNSHLVGNEVYLIELYNATTNTLIRANIPESIQVATQAQWSPRMSASLGDAAGDFASQFFGGFGGAIANAAVGAINGNIMSQLLSWQTWNGTGPLSMSLVLLFDATNDAFVEVVQPMRDLMAISMPKAKGDLLFPPGPSIFYPDQERISIRIGRLMYIHSVVLTDVSCQFDTRMDDYGNPISGQAQITFQTINTPSRQDLISFFSGGGQGENTDYGSTTSVGGII